MPFRYTHAAVVLLLLLAPVWATAEGLRRLGDTVLVYQDVAQPVVLQAMMNVSVSDLEFQVPVFTLVPAAWTYITEAAPFMLMRNFTISSTVQPPTVIDFQYLARRVVLGDAATAVVFDFRDVVFANIRKSNNFGIDFFANSQGSTVVFENVVVVETVCSAAPEVALAAAVSQPALAGYPPNSATLLPSTCVQLPEGRRCFENSLHFDVYSAEAPAQAGGYTFVQLNTTRVCLSYIDPECLRLRDNDVEHCWKQQAQRVQPWLQPAAQHAQLSPGAIAGIAVATGVVAAVAAGVLLLWCRRRNRMHKLPEGEDAMKGTMYHDISLHSRQSGSLYSGGPPSVVSIPRSSSVAGGVQLGVLLGAGSFGRVYRGKWHNSDVAIKVMSCSQAELPRVLKEAEIMIGLEHDNIVRALHCLVVDKQIAVQSSGAYADPKASVSGSTQQRHSSQHSQSSTPGGSTPNGAAAGVPAAGPPSGAVGQGRLGSQIGVGGPKLLPQALAQQSRISLQGQQQHDQHSHLDQQQQQHVSGSVGRFGSGSISMSGSVSRSSSKLAIAIRSLLPGSRDVSSPPAADVTDSYAPPVVNSKDSDVVQHEQPKQQQQQQRHKREPKHIELPPAGRDELLTYPGSSAADRLPEKGEVEVWLVMELCSCGTLREAYSRPRDTMGMARLVSRLLEVAKGMAFLHANNVLHGDLKGANVLLKSTIYSSFGHVSKISDFGLASRLLDGATHRSTQTTGTISHSAPEVLTTGRMSTAADVYSFGIMMWELFTAASAFKGHLGSVVQRVVAGERPAVPEEAPEEYKLLMTSCWSADPRQRPCFNQVVEYLELMLESFTNLTRELAPLQEADGQLEGASAGAAAAAGGGGVGTPAKQQQQQQQGGGAGSAASSERRLGLAYSRHVQDL